MRLIPVFQALTCRKFQAVAIDWGPELFHQDNAVVVQGSLQHCYHCYTCHSHGRHRDMECERSRKWDLSARSGNEPTHCYSEHSMFRWMLQNPEWWIKALYIMKRWWEIFKAPQQARGTHTKQDWASGKGSPACRNCLKASVGNSLLHPSCLNHVPKSPLSLGP